MKVLRRRLEKIEAAAGIKPLPPFPHLTDLTENEAKARIGVWIDSLPDRPLTEMYGQMITELTEKETIALTEYLRAEVE